MEAGLFKGKYSAIWTRFPAYLLMGTVAYVALMLLLSYGVDVRGMNILGLKGWVEQAQPDYPLFWIFAFTEGSPTEQLQWAFLTLAVLLTALQLARLARVPSRIPCGWLFLLVGLTLMLGEDVLNIRHLAAESVGTLLGTPLGTRVGFISLRGLIEVTLYALLGSVMVIALVLLLTDVHALQGGKNWFVAGYCLYFAASVSSATRSVGNWYARLGNALLSYSPVDMAAKVTHPSYEGHVGFYFMDFVVEEPLELLGAACIAAALLAVVTRTTSTGLDRPTHPA